MKVFVCAAVLLCIGGFALGQAPAPPPSSIVGVGNFSHIVANLDKSLTFYRDALGMQADGLPVVRSQLRLAVGSFRTTEDDVRLAWDVLRREAAAL